MTFEEWWKTQGLDNELARSWAKDAWVVAQVQCDLEGDMWWRDALRERPHVDRLVIAWTREHGPLLADRTTSNPQFGWSCMGTVTHWMPLPPLPNFTPDREQH